MPRRARLEATSSAGKAGRGRQTGGVTTAAVLLAAGAGSRYAASSGAAGQHKLLAPLRGRAVLLWALEAVLAAGLDETVLVTGAAAIESLVPEGVTIVHNPRWATGQASSLQVAVDAARARWP